MCVVCKKGKGERMTGQTIKSVAKDCGIHHGLNGGKCHKCAYLKSDYYRSLEYKGLQYQGDSWWAFLGESLPGRTKGEAQP
jgi:hypothetical protein